MSLNAGGMALGISLSVDDAASSVFQQLAGRLGQLEAGAKKAATAIKATAAGVVGSGTPTLSAMAPPSSLASKVKAGGLSSLTEADLKPTVDNINAVGNAVGKIGALVEAAGAKMSQWGQGLIQSSMQGIGMMQQAGGAASLYGKKMAEVSTLVDTSTFPVAELEKIRATMSATYGGDINLMAAALYQSISSGATTAAKATQLMHAANQLAIGGVTDTKTAVDGLTNVLNAYSMSYDDASKVSDAFFVAIRAGKTNATELGTQIGTVASTASQLGISYQEVLGVLAAGSTKMGNASVVATGLKAAMAGIINPTSDAAKEAARLGIQFDQAQVTSMGFQKFLESITTSAKYNSETMSKLFGGSIEALGTMNALAADNGAVFNDTMAQMAASGGSTADAMGKMSESTAQKEAIFAAAMMSASVSIGQAWNEITAPIKEVAAALVNAFNALPSGVKKAIVGFAVFAIVLAGLAGAALVVGGAIVTFVGMVIGGIAALIAAVAGIVAALPLIVAALPLLAAGFAAIIPFLPIIAAVLGVIAAVLGALALAATVVAVVLAGMFVGAVLAVAAFAVAYRDNVGGIATWVESTAAKVKLGWDVISGIIGNGEISGALADEIDKAENSGLKKLVFWIIDNALIAKNYLVGIGEGFSEGIAKIEPQIEEFKTAIGSLFAAFMPTGDTDPGKIFDDTGKSGKSLGQTLAAMGATAITWLSWIATMAMQVVESIRAFGPSFDQMMAPIKMVGQAILDCFGGFGIGEASMEDGADAAARLGQRIGQIASIATVVAGAIASVFAQIAPQVSGAIDIIKGLLQVLVGVFKFTWGQITSDHGLILDGMQDVTKGTVNFIIGLVRAMIGPILVGMDQVMNAIAKARGKAQTSNLAGEFNKLLDSAKAAAEASDGKTAADKAKMPDAKALAQQKKDDAALAELQPEINKQRMAAAAKAVAGYVNEVGGVLDTAAEARQGKPPGAPLAQANTTALMSEFATSVVGAKASVAAGTMDPAVLQSLEALMAKSATAVKAGTMSEAGMKAVQDMLLGIQPQLDAAQVAAENAKQAAARTAAENAATTARDASVGKDSKAAANLMSAGGPAADKDTQMAAFRDLQAAVKKSEADVTKGTMSKDSAAQLRALMVQSGGAAQQGTMSAGAVEAINALLTGLKATPLGKLQPGATVEPVAKPTVAFGNEDRQKVSAPAPMPAVVSAPAPMPAVSLATAQTQQTAQTAKPAPIVYPTMNSTSNITLLIDSEVLSRVLHKSEVRAGASP